VIRYFNSARANFQAFYWLETVTLHSILLLRSYTTFGIVDKVNDYLGDYLIEPRNSIRIVSVVSLISGNYGNSEERARMYHPHARPDPAAYRLKIISGTLDYAHRVNIDVVAFREPIL